MKQCGFCPEEAIRKCDTCGFLCVEHTCVHLRDLDNEYEPLDVVGETTPAKNWLNDEVIIGTMPSEKLKEWLERYRTVIRNIEYELARRGGSDFGDGGRLYRRSIRRTYLDTSGVPLGGKAPAPLAGSQNGPRSVGKKLEYRKARSLKTKVDKLLIGLATGAISKEEIEKRLGSKKEPTE